ncbi:MAG: Asp23/Gls24 family envelope stress response protein [Actinomycetota bacterium]
MSSDSTGWGRAERARAAAEAASAITGVTRLDGGALGEFATYADGERVGGVRIGTEDPSTVRLRVVVAYGRPIPEIAADVEAAVRETLGPRWRPSRVDIEVVDVETGMPDPDHDDRDEGRPVNAGSRR